MRTPGVLPETLISPDPARDAIQALYTRSVDALSGYAQMLKTAPPDYRPVIERFHSLHTRHTEALAGFLADRGHPVDDDASLTRTINRAVIAVRSWFDDSDPDVTNAIRTGEQPVLTAFDEVLAQPLERAEMAYCQDMRDELAALLEQAQRSA